MSDYLVCMEPAACLLPRKGGGWEDGVDLGNVIPT